MRKIVGRLLGIVTLFILLVPQLLVRADIIWEPQDDFYEKHREECEHIGRSYLSNGPEGNVTVWESPVSKKIITYVLNNTRLPVLFSYTDKSGDSWAVVSYNNNYTDYGWIRMLDLSLIYDNISFLEEHEGEFDTYQGELDEYSVKDAVLFWTYPGSGDVTSHITEVDVDLTQSFSYTYTDEEGRIWGHIQYYRGMRGWICLTSPEDENIPAIAVEADVIIPPKEPVEGKGSSEIFTILFPIILVVGLVAITAIIIRVFWKPNKGQKKGEE